MKTGNTDIVDAKIGTTQINKVYLGDNLIWEKGYSAELQAVIDEAVLLGFTLPSVPTLGALNNLINSIKTSGYWNKQDLLFNWGYNDVNLYNFGTINLKNPTGPKGFSVGGQVDMLINGLQGNNASNYFDTNFTPSVNGIHYTLNDASRSYIVSANVSANIIDGNADGNNRCAVTSTANQRVNSTSALNTALNMGTIGLNVLNRRTSSSIRLFRQTVSFNRTQVANVLPTSSQRVFNDASTFSDAIISFYAMGSQLTDPEITTLRTHYNTYLTAIGLPAIA